MKIVNCTPHEVTIIRDQGDIVFKPSGVVARAELKREVVTELDGIPVIFNSPVRTVNLPDPEPGTVYIVSLLTAQAAPDRRDLLVVEDLVRAPGGAVLGCRSLATLHREQTP